MPYSYGNEEFDSSLGRRSSIPPPYTESDIRYYNGQPGRQPEMEERRNYGNQSSGAYAADQARRQASQYGSYGNYGPSGSNPIPADNYSATNYGGSYAPNAPYNSHPPSYATNPPPVNLSGNTYGQYGRMPYPPAAGYAHQPTQTYHRQDFVVTGPQDYQPSVLSSDSSTNTRRSRRPKGAHLERNRRTGKTIFVPASSSQNDDYDGSASTSTRRSKKGSKRERFAKWSLT